MPWLSRPLATAVAARHGIVTAEDLLTEGVSRHQVKRLVRIGALLTIHRGVYRVATSPESFESRCAAACLADPQAVVTGPAAGRLWGFRYVRCEGVPDVLVAHDRTPITRGVRLRRTNVLPEEHVVTRDDGIRLASPPRAWFDCARHLRDDSFEMLTEWVLDRHARVPTLWRTTRQLAARGRPGLARVQRVLSRRATWQRPADSALELRVLRALERQGVTSLVRQHPIRLSNGSLIHADAADPDIRWAVEVDHVTWHGGRFEAQRDKARDRAARRVGWQVERVTDQALDDDFDGEIADLVATYRDRRQEHRARTA